MQIYELSSVKFSHLKLWLCKENDKYEVWLTVLHPSKTVLFPRTEVSQECWMLCELSQGLSIGLIVHFSYY